MSRWRAGNYQFEHAAGAVFRHENAYVQNAPQAFTKDLDQLAWPDWGLVENGSFPGMDYEQGPALGGWEPGLSVEVYVLFASPSGR